MKSLRSMLGFATVAVLSLACCSTLPMQATCGGERRSGQVLDEARCASTPVLSFKAADEDFFEDMDYGATKRPDELAAALKPYIPTITPAEAKNRVVIGRNNWIVWTGGNDQLWDVLSVDSTGLLDFLKVLSSHPSQKYKRNDRWKWYGLVNEPCFEQPTRAREDRFGLWLDTRGPDCKKDPFEDEGNYPGVRIGARGRTVPVGSYYGYATGVVGLRLFPNPAFDEAAAKRWDPERYYTDPTYYNDKNLMKPYRVGMSCGFCHVGPNPTNPPADPEHPKWENLNSNPGAQYFWVDRIFMWDTDKTSFAFQLFHTSRPGALDTSFVSTDYINNPRTMNAIYSLGARMDIAHKLGRERLSGDEQQNAQLTKYVPAGTPLTQFYQAPDTVWTPRVLKDGSDSVGPLGALNRVYVNIGLFSEEWLTHFKPFVGGRHFTPFRIEVAERNSSYWKATEEQTANVALFFLATAKPDLLRNAPGGAAYLGASQQELDHGKTVFAERCARCHSSKLPEQAFRFFEADRCSAQGYLDCWSDYWRWTKTSEFRTAMTRIALAPDFATDNYFSTELRVPVTLTETNACSPLATNALKDDIWDNFSSTSYKNLPSVGTITVHDPYTGAPSSFPMPAGGRGYTRPPSLISLWSTAPFLLNNSLGEKYYRASGSVADRMTSFDGAIRELLWPETREGNLVYVTASGKTLHGKVDVTPNDTFLRVPKGYLPDWLQQFSGPLGSVKPWLFKDGGIDLGPIPAGTPINLISNVDLEQQTAVIPLVAKTLAVFRSMEGVGDPEARRALFAPLVKDFLAASKCKDFVVNRGHYFGTDYFAEEPGLSDADKNALISYLKTI
jgi:hypothetical protein